MTAINAQAKASFAATSFLQQKCHETYVSHLHVLTHQSVKHMLLTTPSSTELFSEDVILSLLTEVKDDLQLSLLCNLSSKGGKQSTSAASYSSQRRCGSSAGRFSSCSHPF